MGDATTPVDVDPVSEPNRVRTALAAVIESDLFAGSERLKSFLTYVVEEAIAGRSATILGKTIAQDVYGRDPQGGSNFDNVVRVDAGRLRRKLDKYYETDGRDDAVRIVIESGQYAPVFQRAEAEPDTGSRPIGSLLVPVFALCAGLAVIWVLWPEQEPVLPENSLARIAERQALVQKSVATVQAANLCDQARGMLFPIADPQGQELATEIFEQAIAQDSSYPCGYSGSAHSLATRALMTPPGERKQAFLNEAVERARKSVELAPQDGWSQSAAAWSAYAAGRFGEARDLSELAVSLKPTDGNILDFRALILLVTGDFDQARSVADPDRTRDLGSYRYAHRNLYAVASFHLGDYRAALASLEAATQSGDPVSALTLLFTAASLQGLGETAKAQEVLDRMHSAWPAFRPAPVLRAFYADPTLADTVLEKLAATGWRRPDPE